MSSSRSLALLCLLSALRASGSSTPGECTVYHPPPVYNMTPTPTNVTHPGYGPGWFFNTNAPVSAPSRMPTSDDEICISKTEPDEIRRTGNYPTTGDVLRITQMSDDGNTVTFKVRQQWTPNPIELLAVQFTEVGGTSPVCKSFTGAAAGPLAPSFKASCTNTNAVVTVIARDPTVFAGEAAYQAPATCGSVPAGKTISITYNVPCNPGCGETVKPLIEDTKAPSKAPSKGPTVAPTGGPTKAPSKTPSKVPTKTPSKTPSKVPTKTPSKGPTKTPTKRPTKTPTKRPTKAPTKSPTKRPTKAPTLKPVTKAPTKTPTKAPTKKPTTAPTNPPDFCLPNIQRDAISGTIEGTSWPIEIVSKNGGTVDIRVKQTFKQGDISWVATQFVDDKTGATVCPKKNTVPFGVVDYSTGDSTPKYPTIIRAKCTKGIAKVAIFVHDGSAPFVSQPIFTVPTICNPSQDTGNKIGLYFSVPCQECAGFAPTTPKALPTKAPTKSPTKRPTKAPTKGPTKSPTKTPTKGPTKGPTKAPTKRPTKVPTKAPTKTPTKAPVTMGPTKRPTKTPTKTPTKSPTKGPTKRPTKTPTKQPTKAPSKTPSKTPTSAPTVCVPRLNITRTGRHGSVEPAGSLIKIVQQSTDGKSVRVSVSQEYKLNALALVAVQFEDVNWGAKCSRFEQVPGGVIDGGSILAKCTSGWANVTVYARDDCFSTVPSFTLPANCGGDVGKIVMQQFRVPCSPGCPGYAPIFDPVPTRAPTKAPTKAPSKTPTKFPTKTPTKRPTKAPTKKPTASPVQACVPLSLKEIKRGGNVTAAEPLVSNIRYGSGGTSVTFTVNQWYKLTNLAHFAVEYTDFNSGATCRNSRSVPSGVFAGDFVARCVNNTATVRVYGYDDCFTNVTGVTIPSICAPPGAGKATMSEFTVPCAVGC